MVSKQTLREVYLSKRLTLTPAEYNRRNQSIINQLTTLIDEKGFSRIHTFLPILSKKEVNTELLIDFYKRDNSKQFILPKMEKKGQLSHYVMNNSCIIKHNRWGIPEPVSGDLADISKLDLVVVPLVIGDKQNHRIGYGKGYYDRFLPQVPQAYKVGVSLLPLLDKIPFVESTDWQLNRVFIPI